MTERQLALKNEIGKEIQALGRRIQSTTDMTVLHQVSMDLVAATNALLKLENRVRKTKRYAVSA